MAFSLGGSPTMRSITHAPRTTGEVVVPLAVTVSTLAWVSSPPRTLSFGIATFRMMLVNMLEGGFISQHDFEIASRIATVVCGGEVERGSTVDEEWLLELERKHFVALAQMPKTQERIMHTLKTGKPLRN